MTTAIITAIYDGYDTVKPTLEQSVDVEWILVTDTWELNNVKTISGWTVKYLAQPELNSYLAAKIPKVTPTMFTKCKQSIWIDASFRVTSPTFAQEVMEYADPIAHFVHPWRDCIYQECNTLLQLPKKHNGQPILEQVKAYEEDSHPKNWGLWATGVMARKHTKEVIEFQRLWLGEIVKWSLRDQLSHPYALRKANLRPNKLPGTHFSNPWLAYEGSGRH